MSRIGRFGHEGRRGVLGGSITSNLIALRSVSLAFGGLKVLQEVASLPATQSPPCPGFGDAVGVGHGGHVGAGDRAAQLFQAGEHVPLVIRVPRIVWSINSRMRGVTTFGASVAPLWIDELIDDDPAIEDPDRITIEAWVNTLSWPSRAVVCRKEGSYILYNYSGGFSWYLYGPDTRLQHDIAGTLGKGPATIPMTVTLESGRGPARTFRYNVVNDQLFTPLQLRSAGELIARIDRA